MRSNKGMSVTSLIIYVIVFVTVVGTASLLIKFFYRNNEELLNSEKSSSQYTRLLSYISDDINSRKNKKRYN